jgi:hypothetical protein
VIKQKRDDNEAEIIQFVRSVGAGAQKMDKSAGHDWTIYFLGRVYIAEVKNPAYKWKLTKREQELREMLEAHEVTYWILESWKDAADMLGVQIKRR